MLCLTSSEFIFVTGILDEEAKQIMRPGMSFTIGIWHLLS